MTNEPKDYVASEPEIKELCHSGKILCWLAALSGGWLIFYFIYYLFRSILSMLNIG